MMHIFHPLDDFTYDLFLTGKERDIEQLKQKMTDFYSVGPYKPKITVKEKQIEVEIDATLIEEQQKAYQEVISLSEQGKYDLAKDKLLPLIQKAPHVSEYHRVLGQIYSEIGDQDEAINSLIDALKWDRKNGWALLMMGNIFARHHRDIGTALKYYKEAAKANPEDNITLNNIGAIMLQAGRNKEAIDFLLQAKDINPDYPNTYHALAMAEESEGNLLGAFNYAISAIKKNPNRDNLYTESLRYAMHLAQKLMEEGKGRSLMNKYTRELEERTGKRIDTVEDDSISTAAKIEFAENYSRDRHIIRYKPSYPAVEHLVMHELVHLDLVTEARQEQKNQLFTTSLAHSKTFDRDMEKDAKRLRKQGLPEDSVKGFLSSIFNGLNLQVYNTPIDLFIEDFLYSTYKELRPYQFLSLMRMAQEGIKATTDKTIVAHAPKAVVSASKVYNLVNAMHLRDLYGVNLVADFKATPKEVKQAEEFMEEFEEYRYDREPAEEYELVQNWADDLELSSYFELVEEASHRTGKSPEDVVSEMEENAMDAVYSDPYEEQQMRTFQEEHKDKDLNMAVAMYMVDALKYFSKLPQDKVKAIAHEIAMKGMYGIHPDRKDYTLPSIPSKTFTGYHLLAYYYVSWAIAEPQFLPELQLPFDKEYSVAKQLQEGK
ncbi:tetratricopeptide repeat protein [Pontibacter korlensis]|nr:tetratricopeptide repeat protein [Pontibacter korlensis]